MYKEEDKYSDGTDSFDYKRKIFLNNCNNACVEKKYLKDALTIMFTGDASEKYLDLTLHDENLSFDERCNLIKSHYETVHCVNRRETIWNTLNLIEEMRKIPDKLQAFNNLEKELRRVQRGLESHAGDAALRTRIINACSGVADLHFVLFSPAKTAEGVCADIRARFMQLSLSGTSISQYHQLDHIEHNSFDGSYLAGRQYQSVRGSSTGRGNQNFRGRRKIGSGPSMVKSTWNKRCIVCKKTNCWSSEHTPEEQRAASEKIKKTYPSKDENAVQQFILQFEGESPDAELHYFLAVNELTDEPESEDGYCYQEESQKFLISEIGGENVAGYLQDQTTLHKFTAPKTKYAAPKQEEKILVTVASLDFDFPGVNKSFDLETATPEVFHLFRKVFFIGNDYNERYDERVFHGVLVDTGAAGHSTVGVGQAKALKHLQKELKVDRTKAGEVKISGIGVTPDVQKNVMIKNQKPVAALIRKYGHLWMTLGHFQSLFIYESNNEPICDLTEQKIRTCHRRWGHPSASRMWKIFRRAGHDIDIKIIDRISKFCNDCQLNAHRPLRFKFTLTNKDVPFNHTVYVDVMYLEDGPAVHLIDAGTNLGSADFLTGPKKEGAISTCNSIERCWNNVYIGPPENLIHDAGKNFASAEFRATASGWKTRVVEVPIEAHNSIGKVEQAHKDLRRAYTIFKQQFSGQNVDRHSILKMAVKALNDSAGPDGLVPSLCAFGAYPRITWNDAPAPVSKQRPDAMQKAMDELQKHRATQLINQAKNMRNGPRHTRLEDIPVGDKVRVWREATKNTRGRWTGPFELYNKEGETITVLINGEKKNFRSTTVNKWFEDNEDPNTQRDASSEQPPLNPEINLENDSTPSLRLRRSQRDGRFTGQYQTEDHLNISPEIQSHLYLKPFSISGMQVDDILFLGTEEFLRLEDTKLIEAKFPAKPIERLSEKIPLQFNGLLITLRDNALHIGTNGQGKKIKLVNLQDPNRLDIYKRQRALGTWMSSNCQPLVAFKLSRAAQFQNPEEQEIKDLNSALREQQKDVNRGLRYINLDLDKLKAYCWVDGSFANNKDLTSQIGFVITLGNETFGENKFTFCASELYAMTNGIDIAIPLCMTANQIMDQLALPMVPLIVCTDSRSLYECLVKLGTTKEKRLMIDVMAIRESYERKELAEIRWINGKDNPADSMTKVNATSALNKLIDSNELTVRLEGRVERK
ncbi:hypothetical protein K3495_g11869 [Podosphaera aphanis]|nr:hypothetical protein K3495_g11869 [Podosphaera aphanis]